MSQGVGAAAQVPVRNCDEPSCLKQGANKLCGRCSLVRYCDQGCQRKHLAAHKDSCIANTYAACLKAIRYAVEKKGGKPRFTLDQVAKKYALLPKKEQEEISWHVIPLISPIILNDPHYQEHPLVQCFYNIKPDMKVGHEWVSRQYDYAARTGQQFTLGTIIDGKKVPAVFRDFSKNPEPKK